MGACFFSLIRLSSCSNFSVSSCLLRCKDSYNSDGIFSFSFCFCFSFSCRCKSSTCCSRCFVCRSLAFCLLRFRRFFLIFRTDLVDDLSGDDGGGGVGMVGGEGVVEELSLLIKSSTFWIFA